ncbi:MAG: hypothetical protein WKF75_12920 [Singulisphaera sp.]
MLELKVMSWLVVEEMTVEAPGLVRAHTATRRGRSGHEGRLP